MHFWSWVLPTKFDGHRAFLKQLDLWMTFDLWLGCFENMLSNSDPYTHIMFHLDTSKHDETHTRKYILTHTLTYFGPLDFQV